jgi:hypothetical protein
MPSFRGKTVGYGIKLVHEVQKGYGAACAICETVPVAVAMASNGYVPAEACGTLMQEHR